MDRGIIESLQNIVNKASHYVEFKLFGSVVITAVAFLFDGALKAGLISLFLLIIFDFFTAIANAYHKKIEIQSRKILTTAVKMVIYFGLIASANLAEHAVPLLESILDETILAFLSLTELISILENCGKLGFAIPKKLLNKLEDLRDSK